MCTGCAAYGGRAYTFALRIGVENKSEREACVVAKGPNNGAECIVMGRDGRARETAEILARGNETVTDGRREKSSSERVTAAAVDDDDWRDRRGRLDPFIYLSSVYT